MPHYDSFVKGLPPFLRKKKGRNEKLSGLLREFYPKGETLSRVSSATLKRHLSLIDAVPKKVLQYSTPQE